jgi:hypothetical protein
MNQQITWINKPGGSKNPSTHIIGVGGVNWSQSARDAVNNILNNTGSYFVSNANGTVAVGLGTLNGFYYLKTIPDGTPLDNLLSLPNIAIV